MTEARNSKEKAINKLNNTLDYMASIYKLHTSEPNNWSDYYFLVYDDAGWPDKFSYVFYLPL